MPRLSEIRYGVPLEGIKVKIAAIEGSLVTVIGLGFIEDDEWPGVVVVFRKGDQCGWFACYSRIILETLEKYKEDLPFDCMFLQHESATGRKFWTVE